MDVVLGLVIISKPEISNRTSSSADVRQTEDDARPGADREPSSVRSGNEYEKAVGKLGKLATCSVAPNLAAPLNQHAN